MNFETVSLISLLLAAMAIFLAALIYLTSRRRKMLHNKLVNHEDVEKVAAKTLPGPTPFPIVGNIPQISKYENNPYEGFSILSKKYGSIYKLQLGSTPCVVVSSLEHIMEVLIKKGQSFDGRPNFRRWNTYFAGNRQHSLALCDWSDIQKTRRNVVRAHLMIKQNSHKQEIEECTTSEISHLLNEIENTKSEPNFAKSLISNFTMNVFMQYMCSSRFDYDDEEFRSLVKCFDNIFEDINDGHPTDFLPWLSPFFQSYEKNVHSMADSIRKFILEKIIRDRPQNFDVNNVNDLVDALLANHLNHDDGKLNLDWQNILFALEDLLGGSSAISNVVMRVLYYITQNPSVQLKIQKEIDEVVGSSRLPTQDDRVNMKYTEATIYESLRHTSSPIVPHVANEDSSIGGFHVSKGTVIMINNYELNVSPSLWDKPNEFEPERFIVQGKLKKPSHFLPFSTGKRACIGSKLLMNLTFASVASILQRYSMAIPDGVIADVPVGKLALSEQGFPIVFSSR